jgi:hypothetical protein
VQILHGEALYKLGRNQEADVAFGRALAIQGKLLSGDPPSGMDKLSAEALVGLGRVEVKQNKKRGIAILRAAEKKENAPEDVHCYLGEVLIGSAKTQKVGKKELERCVGRAENSELKAKAEELLKKR